MFWELSKMFAFLISLYFYFIFGPHLRVFIWFTSSKTPKILIVAWGNTKKVLFFNFYNFFEKIFHNCNCRFFNTLGMKMWENTTILKTYIFAHIVWEFGEKWGLKKGAQRGYPIDFFEKFHNSYYRFVF